LELCEPVLWGEVLPETRDALAELTAAVEAFDAERERLAAEKLREEEARRAEDERRRAEWLEKTRGEQVGWTPAPARAETPGAPVSRFRKDPSAPVPPNPMVFDPTAAHVPDPADPSKQIVVSPGVSVWDAKKHEPARMAGFVDDGPGFMRSEAPEKLPDHEKYYRGENYDGDPRY
jgi:hypothetical protein